MKHTKSKFLFSGETTDLKYRINVKVEKNIFQMMPFGAKSEYSTAEISLFKNSEFSDFIVDCHAMFT